MKRAILMSIQPQWLEKILNREKLIEIRKTMPKCELPIDVYLYCTKEDELWGDGSGNTWKGIDSEEDLEEVFRLNHTLTRLNGKIVAKFNLNEVDKYTSEFVDDDCYEEIRYVYLNEDGEEEDEVVFTNEISDNELNNWEFPNSCVKYKELKEYVGTNFFSKPFYAWHIDNLQIFDKPMELSDFHKPCICPKMQYCPSCPKGYVYMSEDEEEYYRATNGQEGCETEWVCLNVVEKAPQSWRYVEVKE